MSQQFIVPPRTSDGNEIRKFYVKVCQYVNALMTRYTTRTGTADPTGSVTPVYIGERYIDTTAHKVYIAEGLTSSSWLVLN